MVPLTCFDLIVGRDVQLIRKRPRLRSAARTPALRPKSWRRESYISGRRSIGERILYSEHFENGEDLFKQAELGLEGSLARNRTQLTNRRNQVGSKLNAR